MSTPKKSDATAPVTAAINKSLLLSPQSKGALAKSLLAAAEIEWLLYAGVPFRALDSDALNQSLFKRYPTIAGFFDATEENNFGELLDQVKDLQEPVVVFDAPAQFTTNFLAHADHFQMLAMFARRGIKLVMSIFTSDDEDAMRSASDVVDYFGREEHAPYAANVQYILVDNPRHFSSQEFKRSGLYEHLVSLGAPTIELPWINKVSKLAWEDVEQRDGGYLTLGNVIKRPDLSDVAQLELSGFLDRMLVQFEDNAAVLLPDAGLIKTKVTRVKARAPQQRTNRFQSRFMAKK
jgi:hypothetical protein